MDTIQSLAAKKSSPPQRMWPAAAVGGGGVEQGAVALDRLFGSLSTLRFSIRASGVGEGEQSEDFLKDRHGRWFA